MGIPIYVSRVPRTQVLAPVQVQCPRCYQMAVHQVARHYFSVHVYFIPMFSAGTEHEYICSSCYLSRQGPVPAGAISKPFLHRFGCLVFVVLPILGLILYMTVDKWLTRQHWAALEAEQKAKEEERAALKAKTDEVVTAARGAKSALEAARKKCSQTIDDVINALPKKVKVVDMPAQKAADPAALAGAGYVVIKTTGGGYIPIPDSKYFGKQACFVEIPKELDDAARYNAIGAFVAPETILDQAKALNEQAKALAVPPAIVVTELSCPNARKKCAGTAVWMSTADKKTLAVVRVEKAVEHNGEKQDREALATLLKDETAKW
jgi:hypothetical protein